MITAEQKTQWIEALRSGKYKQGQRRLRKDGRYCCLGVLAEQLGLFYSFVEEISGSPSSFVEGSPFYLPSDVMPREFQHIIARKNDCGESFNTIADYIEQADFEKPE